MENHPIPQDVTGFQFKLIGNMTVKQFAYLATGSIMGVLFYYAPLFILIKLLFIPLFIGSGAALAFMPFEGRPLDVMLTQFIKALISPNQYVFQKTGVHFAFTSFSPATHVAPQSASSTKKSVREHEEEKKQAALATYLARLPKRSDTPIDQKESVFLTNLFSNVKIPPLPSLPQIQPAMQVPSFQAPTPPPAPPASPQPADPKQLEQELLNQAAVMQQALQVAKTEEAQAPLAGEAAIHAHEHTQALEKQLQEILAQKERLEAEFLKLKNQLQNPTPTSVYAVGQQGQSTGAAQLQDDHVKKITPQQQRAKGIMHTPDVPNVILGVVTDPRNNILSNILVEVKDKDGNPVRAFKTNELGQFASATPLANGVYNMEFEDPKGTHRFDTVEIAASGEILAPLEVVSHDDRDELRKALFA